MTIKNLTCRSTAPDTTTQSWIPIAATQGRFDTIACDQNELQTWNCELSQGVQRSWPQHLPVLLGGQSWCKHGRLVELDYANEVDRAREEGQAKCYNVHSQIALLNCENKPNLLQLMIELVQRVEQDRADDNIFEDLEN